MNKISRQYWTMLNRFLEITIKMDVNAAMHLLESFKMSWTIKELVCKRESFFLIHPDCLDIFPFVFASFCSSLYCNIAGLFAKHYVYHLGRGTEIIIVTNISWQKLHIYDFPNQCISIIHQRLYLHSRLISSLLNCVVH